MLVVDLNGVQSAEGVRELAKGVFLLEQFPQLARLQGTQVRAT